MSQKRTQQEFESAEYTISAAFRPKRPRHAIDRDFCSLPESNGLYQHHSYDLRHHRKPQPTSLGYYRSAAGYNYSSNRTSKNGGSDVQRNAHSFSVNGHRGSSNAATVSLALHKRKLEDWGEGGLEQEKKRHFVTYSKCVSFHG